MIPPIAKRFVAGEEQHEAITHVEEINRWGISGILNLLGEHYTEPDKPEKDTEAYIELIQKINTNHLDASISVKPTQIGLLIDKEEFRTNLEKINKEADEHDVFVWLDMEDHTTTSHTLEAYREAAETGYDIGICIQSNLKRTKADLMEIKDLPGGIRLVKGAYNEPEEIAHRAREDATDALKRHTEYALKNMNQRIAVGSHDPDVIHHALHQAEKHSRDIEIQMLMGVSTETQRNLAEDVDVAQYIPFGDEWMSYFYRRMKERKENLIFAARAILKG